MSNKLPHLRPRWVGDNPVNPFSISEEVSSVSYLAPVFCVRRNVVEEGSFSSAGVEDAACGFEVVDDFDSKFDRGVNQVQLGPVLTWRQHTGYIYRCTTYSILYQGCEDLSSKIVSGGIPASSKASTGSSSTQTALSLRSFRQSWIISVHVSHGSHAFISLLYRGCDSRQSQILQRILNSFHTT
jgi:hypothetical protein